MAPKRPIGLQRLFRREAQVPDSVADQIAAARPDDEPGKDDDPDTDKDTDDRPELTPVMPQSGADQFDTPAAVAGLDAAVARLRGEDDEAFDPFGEALEEIEDRTDDVQEQRDQLREQARHGLQDEAADFDQGNRLGEQGNDLAAYDGQSESSKARANWLINLFKSDKAPDSHTGATSTDEGVVQTGKPIDPTKVDSDMKAGANLILSNLRAGNDMTAERSETANGTIIEKAPDGTLTATFKDGKVVRKEPDGSVRITMPDGSTTTKAPNGEIKDAPPPPPPPPSDPSKPGMPDPDDVDHLDPEVAALLGLDDFMVSLMPTPPPGGGHTDPADESFGVGAIEEGTVVPDTQDRLLGGDNRGISPGDGSGGSIDQETALNPLQGGVIDPTDDADPGFGGGGLEDDPLAGNGQPSLGLDGLGDEPADDQPADEDAADATFVGSFELIGNSTLTAPPGAVTALQGALRGTADESAADDTGSTDDGEDDSTT